MIRERLVKREVGVEPGFRWRGGEITRIEGFSDAVFAFAVTLLVVSLEVPRTFDELLETMRGFVAFAICFLMLMLVWSWHYTFFRRYGLQDTFVVILNGILLFLVLFYVYPLKFLFSLLVDALMGRGDLVTLADGSRISRMHLDQGPTLMAIYGVGYLAVAVTFAILYAYAYRKRDELALDERELVLTRSSIQRYLLIGGVGLISVLIALIGGPSAVAVAGYSYSLLWPALLIHGRLARRQLEAINSANPPGRRRRNNDRVAK
jgi:hypothetical protein